MNTNSNIFVPPHCPNSNCPFHSGLRQRWRFKRIGYHWSHCQKKRIPRFLCLCCRRSFSSQTFATTYWLKKPEVLGQLVMKTVGCMANRQIARDLRVAPSTIDRQLARLGRHCLLYHTQQMQAAKPASAVVIDGFVSFEHSQFWPFHHHPAIEPGSDLIVYFTDSEVRRSGTMTDAQKRKRERLEQQYGRPDPKAVLKDVTHLLEVVAGGQEHLTVLSDEHQAYPRAIRKLPCEVTHLVTSQGRRMHNRLPGEPGGYAAHSRPITSGRRSLVERRQASAERSVGERAKARRPRPRRADGWRCEC
ncbi:MAG: hypothetical protein IPI48_05955 [bacterium]|nr:hypothetical protein [bacterium]